MNTNRQGLLIVAIVVPWVLVFLGIAAYFLIFRDTRQDLSPRDFVLDASSDLPAIAEAFAGLHDESTRLCPEKPEQSDLCIEAYVGDNLTLYRFRSKVVARAFARVDTAKRYASDWLVIEFTNPELSPDAKAAAETVVDEAWIAE